MLRQQQRLLTDKVFCDYTKSFNALRGLILTYLRAGLT